VIPFLGGESQVFYQCGGPIGCKFQLNEKGERSSKRQELKFGEKKKRITLEGQRVNLTGGGSKKENI